MFENAENFAWLILFLPLAAVAAIVASTAVKGDNPRLSAQISCVAALAAFGTSVVLYYFLVASGSNSLPQVSRSWLSIRELSVDIGLRLDRLSLMMAMIVTGVGSVIHIYSAGYMAGDRAYTRYFACLSLFLFSMLGIVLADNFVMMFIFWELVGVSSYLLIGFWYEKASAADACKKAFLTNRVGDFGFLVGILLVWSTLGHHLNFEELANYLPSHIDNYLPVATAAGLLIFCGAAGKSAQFPLHVWLPDAMEGPTPVSALIHAATMVAAGVYMLCRVYFLLAVPGSYALEVIAWVGGFTALFASVVAIQQNDIKRILAYSTLSQLGYMVMAVGMGGQTPAMFHLATHAFFKALLFLGAGSVILGVHHEQNIWKMGGLRKKMPVTFWTFMVGTLALCGLWPFSGFFSKDSILGLALETHHIGLFVVGLIGAVLTTFYMFRLVFVVFFSGERSEATAHAHESTGIMVWPLRVLAFFSVIGGVIGIQQVFGKQLGGAPGAEEVGFVQGLLAPFNESPMAAMFGLFAVIIGFAMAYALYRSRLADPLPEKLGWLSRAMRNAFYFDQLYERILIPYTQEALARIAAGIEWLISGVAVRGSQGATDIFGRALRLLQTGNLQTYAFLLVAGVALVVYLVLAR
ncbi:MAG: dehydrogenase subunit [Pedosphaera sp.]|nr:dehydrogenase subunit [Pedosphaera sp.]